MPTYAADTTVAPERSRAEIERTLTRYGAQRFMYGWEEGRAVIAFEAHGRRLRFELVLPDPKDRAFTRTATGRLRTTSTGIREAYEQATRQRWRALALIIKAKLEAIESGIATFDTEFLPYIVLPRGDQTVGEWLAPQIDEVYRTGLLPPMLPGASDPRDQPRAILIEGADDGR